MREKERGKNQIDERECQAKPRHTFERKALMVLFTETVTENSLSEVRVKLLEAAGLLLPIMGYRILGCLLSHEKDVSVIIRPQMRRWRRSTYKLWNPKTAVTIAFWYY